MTPAGEALAAWVAARRQTLTAAAAGLYALTLVLIVWTQTAGALPGERWLLVHLYRRPTRDVVGQATSFFGDLGSPLVALLTVAVVAWFIARRCGVRWGVLTPLVFGAPVIANIIKRASGPTELASLLQGLPPQTIGSLPSGHAAFVSALFGLVAVLGLAAGRRDVAVAAAIPVLATGPTQVLRGAHFPADMVAGYALGFAWLLTLLLLGARAWPAVGAGGSVTGAAAPGSPRRT